MLKHRRTRREQPKAPRWIQWDGHAVVVDIPPDGRGLSLATYCRLFLPGRRRTRARGYVPTWHPKTETVALLEAVDGVLRRYDEYLPLTLRQVFYALVALSVLAKEERAYHRLGEHLNTARRAGRISFDAIRDDGTAIHRSIAYKDAENFLDVVDAAAKAFRLDRQRGQPLHLAVLVEAAGMAGQVHGVTADYGVPVWSDGGFNSVTATRRLGQHCAAWADECHAVELLHIGDHDPSGGHLAAAALEDIQAFSGLGDRLRMTRLAVLPEQVAQFGLPSAPPKSSDRRAWEGQTWQAEALPPDVLLGIVRDAIERRINVDARQSVLEREIKIRADLSRRLRGQ